jgi:hypothetical protein
LFSPATLAKKGRLNGVPLTVKALAAAEPPKVSLVERGAAHKGALTDALTDACARNGWQLRFQLNLAPTMRVPWLERR